MNKGDLVAEVAKVVKSKRMAEDAVSCVFEAITSLLRRGRPSRSWGSEPSEWANGKPAWAGTRRPERRSDCGEESSKFSAGRPSRAP